MMLSYEQRVEDYIAFSRFHLKRPGMARKRLFWSLIVGGEFAPIVWGLCHQNLLLGAAAGLLGTAAFYSGIPALKEKMIRSGSPIDQFPVGATRLEVTPEGVVERGDKHTLRTTWRQLGDVVTDGDYTFLYRDGRSAHIIPRKRVTEGTPDTFLEEMARHREVSTEALPTGRREGG